MRYVLGVIGLIILAILAIALIGRTGNQPAQEGKPVVKLVDYENSGARVTHTTEGRIVGEDAHKSIRITVDRNERKAEVLTGYQGSVEKSQSWPNNSEAFQVFIRALSNAGFTRERETTQKDERGICPQGNRFIYQLNDESDKEVTRLWSTSCGSKLGTFGGDTSTIRRLFQDQITGYNKFVSGVKL